MKHCGIFLKKMNNKKINIPKNLYTHQLSPHNIEVLNTSTYLTQAILLEVCTHPKPGLVTRLSKGSHNDMSILTFAMSSAVLGQVFSDLQDIGMTHSGCEKELFAKVRSYGILAEKELLRVTKGINTQRGILFAGGLVSAAAGYAYNQGFDKENIISIVMKMTDGLVESELEKLDVEVKTAGEKLYKEYGITGIRGEVEKGFPSVLNYGLPALTEAFDKGASLNDALLHSLISLMTVVEDSNVIWRTDVEMAENVKNIAKDIISAGSIFTSQGWEKIKQAEEYFCSRRISPGGSADLLSVTISLYLIENKEFPVDIV